MSKYGEYTGNQIEAVLNMIGGKSVIDLFLARKAKITVEKLKDLSLEPIGIVTTSATTQPFVAREKFDKNNRVVKFSYFGDNFTKELLDKIEDPIGKQTLQYQELKKNSMDGPIITELGGEEVVETTLTEIYDLLVKHSKGEKSGLLTNGYANIFYVKNTAGVLRAVRVYWYDDGWNVNAYSVSDPRAWHGGRQVFSRNSALEPSDTSAPAQA